MLNYLENDFFNYEGMMNISDDCPIFPLGEGWEITLINLANYPFGYKLFELEDVAGIKIFINRPVKSILDNPYDEKYFHCAVFNDDLIELHQRGFIEGVTPGTEYDRDLKIYHDLIDKGFQVDNAGNLIMYFDNPKFRKTLQKKPQIIDYIEDYLGEKYQEEYLDELIEDYEKDNKPFPIIEDHIVLTDSGINAVKSMSQDFSIPKSIDEMIGGIIRLKKYDSAIREMAVYLEYTLKRFHKSKKYGHKLIDLHIDECIKANNGKNNAGIKLYRQELRTINSYIRNYYIHNVVRLDEISFKTILYRQIKLYNLVNKAFEIIKKQK